MIQHQPGSPSPVPGAPAPVLDIEAGVDRMMGNRAIYLRALARFRQDYRNALPAIRAALGAGDAAQARRLAHTLKGAAGMIEAPGLYRAALALEQALRQGAGGVDGLLVQAGATLAAVLRELDAMRLEDAPSGAPAAAPGNSVARLRAMLDIGDGAAVELLAAARSELCACMGEGKFEKLSAAVADFDYEHALEVLDRPEQAG